MSDLEAIKQANVVQRKRAQSRSKEQIPDVGIPAQPRDADGKLGARNAEAFQASAEAARDKFGEAANAAKEVAGSTMEQVQSRVREQQQTGADFVERLAGNIREAADAFEDDVPFAARGINSAADYIEEAAAKIRDGSFRDLVDGATDFAKRQPTAFLGLSVLAGFAVVRFFKASDGKSSRTASGNQRVSSQQGGSPS